MVRQRGFEPLTHSLEGCCSIQLSYGADSLPQKISISALGIKNGTKKHVASWLESIIISGLLKLTRPGMPC